MSGKTPASTDVLKGLSQIVNPQNVQENIDYSEIEKMYLGSAKVEEKENNPTESFRKDLKELANRLELSFDTPVNSRSTPREPLLEPSPIKNRSDPSVKKTPGISFAKTPSSSSHGGFSTPSIGDHLKTPSGYKSPSAPSPISSFGHGSAESNGSEDDDDYDSGGGAYSSSSGGGGGSTYGNSYNSGSAYSGGAYGDESRSTGRTELERRTNEEVRHDQIRDVMNEMGAANTTIFTLEQTRRQDEKLTMLDEIASLKMSLEEDEAKGIENIPRVDSHSSYEEVESVLKSYRLINDRMRYCSLADEFILWGAQGMEELFNGKRTWFGRYNPDLTGWSKQVSVKLRRMRHETSQLVGGVMHDYNIGPGMRIILELIPNMFMYARTKKQNYGKPTLMSDAEISAAISDIRDHQ